MNPTIRVAAPADCHDLTDLAMRSKAWWGYDEAFMEACREELTFAPSRLDTERVVVAEIDASLAGVASVRVVDGVADLMDLFVDPPHIGSGLGSTLLAEARRLAVDAGATILRIEADPHAEAWYRARGAVPVGRAPSGSIPGRMLPLLELDLRPGVEDRRPPSP